MAACDDERPGEFYLERLATHSEIKRFTTEEVLRTVSILPGISAVLHPVFKVKEIVRMTRQILNQNFGFATAGLFTITKIVNKASRLIPFRPLRFAIRNITSQIYRPNPRQLTVNIARELNLK